MRSWISNFRHQKSRVKEMVKHSKTSDKLTCSLIFAVSMGSVIASATHAAKPALISLETSSVDLRTGGEVIWTSPLVRVCDIFQGT